MNRAAIIILVCKDLLMICFVHVKHPHDKSKMPTPRVSTPCGLRESRNGASRYFISLTDPRSLRRFGVHELAFRPSLQANHTRRAARRRKLQDGIRGQSRTSKCRWLFRAKPACKATRCQDVARPHEQAFVFFRVLFDDTRYNCNRRVLAQAF